MISKKLQIPQQNWETPLVPPPNAQINILFIKLKHSFYKVYCQKLLNIKLSRSIIHKKLESGK